MNLYEEKEAIRVKARDDRICLDNRHYLSGRVQRSVLKLPEYGKAGTVMLYVAFGSEVETAPLIEHSLERKKRVLLPLVIDEHMMNAVEVGDFKDLVPGKLMGIPEPGKGEPYGGKIDLILVPGVAFDEAGNRVGQGKAYYDVFLRKHVNDMKIGLAFECQIFPRIPTHEWDVPVDKIVTDERVIDCVARR
jgi:5-formyltetrahydrofolate cyclo-ligase